MRANKCPTFQAFSAKFPVRIEPGIFWSNREFFLSNREISSAKPGNRCAHALAGREKRAPQLKATGISIMARPSLLEEKGASVR